MVKGFWELMHEFFCPVKQTWLAGKMDLLTGQFASNLQSLVGITDCALTVCCFWVMNGLGLLLFFGGVLFFGGTVDGNQKSAELTS